MLLKQAKRTFITLILSFFFLSTFVVPVLAASSTYLSEATKYLTKECNKRKVKGDEAAICYLFEKIKEQEQKIATIEDNLHEQDDSFTHDKVVDVCFHVPNGALTVMQNGTCGNDVHWQIPVKCVDGKPCQPDNPQDPFFEISLAQNKPAPALTTFAIPDGYKTITFHVSSTQNVVGFSPGISFDGGTTYHELQRFGCNAQVCPDVTVPILSDTYNIGTGTNSGNVTISATLNTEPDAQVLLLGQAVVYPYTSQPFSTDGFSTITISVGSGDNPQHVTGISLQRFESGSFVQKEFIACDGGATCPMVSRPVLGGQYRVVLQGTGTNAVLGAILRP